MPDIKTKILDTALTHVIFDGWSDTTLAATAEDLGITSADIIAHYPRGAVDLALAFHRRGDAAMEEVLAGETFAGLKIREKITFAIRTRLSLMEGQQEEVRRGTTLFTLPIYAADGARALWETADKIWTAIGDTSEDVNWYTKRMTLSGVYSATVLYWLGDQSEGHSATWDFLDRRIEDVMRIETLKSNLRDNKLLAPFMAGPNWLASQIRAPKAGPRDMPGRWNGGPRDSGQ